MIQPSHAGFRLVACGPDGLPSPPIDDLPPDMAAMGSATAELYRRVGFEPPWIGYVALWGATAVGGGAFTAPPRRNRVEIAYFTLPGQEGRGFATRTARQLLAIARTAEPRMEVFAKTAPEENASTAILRQLGFAHLGETSDHEIGLAWAWLHRT